MESEGVGKGGGSLKKLLENCRTVTLNGHEPLYFRNKNYNENPKVKTIRIYY